MEQNNDLGDTGYLGAQARARRFAARNSSSEVRSIGGGGGRWCDVKEEEEPPARVKGFMLQALYRDRTERRWWISGRWVCGRFVSGKGRSSVATRRDPCVRPFRGLIGEEELNVFVALEGSGLWSAEAELECRHLPPPVDSQIVCGVEGRNSEGSLDRPHRAPSAPLVAPRVWLVEQHMQNGGGVGLVKLR